MIFHHFTQRVDVLPRPPVVLLPDNVDLTDDACNRLDGDMTEGRDGAEYLYSFVRKYKDEKSYVKTNLAKHQVLIGSQQVKGCLVFNNREILQSSKLSSWDLLTFLQKSNEKKNSSMISDNSAEIQNYKKENIALKSLKGMVLRTEAIV